MGHTLHPANLLGQEAQADNTQPNKVTSPPDSRSVPSLHSFSPRLALRSGQSPYSTKARRILLELGAVQKQRGQSRPRTKPDILCCSASISCALLHLNTAPTHLQNDLNTTPNISVQPQCFSMLHLNTAEYVSKLLLQRI